MSTYRRAWMFIGLALFFLYVVYRGANRGSDFKYPYYAAQALWRTHQFHVRAQPRYPISFHVLLAPIAALPLWLASAVWAALSMVAVATLPKVIQALSGLSFREQGPIWLFSLPFLIDALVLGQSDPINLALVLWSLVALEQGWLLVAAGMVGLAGMIKILPIFHWATLIARTRHWQLWLGIALTILFGIGIVVAGAGTSDALLAARQQFNWLSQRERPWHLLERGADLRVNNESLPIALARTMGRIEPRPPLHALSLDLLSFETIWWVWSGMILSLVVGWLACAWAVRKNHSTRALLALGSLTSILMLACTPICWHHYFLWLLPSLTYFGDRRKLLWSGGGFSLVVSALPVARGMGLHMMIALLLYTLITIDVLKQAQREGDADSSCSRTFG